MRERTSIDATEERSYCRSHLSSGYSFQNQGCGRHTRARSLTHVFWCHSEVTDAPATAIGAHHIYTIPVRYTSAGCCTEAASPHCVAFWIKRFTRPSPHTTEWSWPAPPVPGATAYLEEFDREEVLACSTVHQVLEDRAHDGFVRELPTFCQRDVDENGPGLHRIKDAIAVSDIESIPAFSGVYLGGKQAPCRRILRAQNGKTKEPNAQQLVVDQVEGMSPKTSSSSEAASRLHNMFVSTTNPSNGQAPKHHAHVSVVDSEI